MIARQQNLGHRHIPPNLRTGVLGIFQHAAPVALVLEAGGFGQHTGHHPADGVGDDHGSQLAAGEHKVTDGQLFVDAGIHEPPIYALVVAAHQNHVLPGQQFPGLCLIKPGTGGAHQDGVHLFVLLHVLQTAGQRLALHDHALTAAVRVIVGAAALVGGVVPDVVAANVDQSGFPAPADDALAEGMIHHFGEQGQNVNSHGAASLRWCAGSAPSFPDPHPDGRVPRRGSAPPVRRSR